MAGQQVDYKERIVTLLDTLPTSRLRSILDYVEYLRDREAWEETKEILADKDLLARLEEADRDWKGGRYEEGDYVDRASVEGRV
ncbi:MAG: hypothetical protein Q8O86_13275 [Dehalococcoidia bacterium]|nr:hypothetical protein [Dehalococcoidia bacterium]